MRSQKLAGRRFSQSQAARRGERLDGIPAVLLDRAGDGRKDGIGIASDEPDRPNYDYQNHRQHYRVFRDVLTLIFPPKPAENVYHLHSPSRETKPKTGLRSL